MFKLHRMFYLKKQCLKDKYFVLKAEMVIRNMKTTN